MLCVLSLLLFLATKIYSFVLILIVAYAFLGIVSVVADSASGLPFLIPTTINARIKMNDYIIAI